MRDRQAKVQDVARDIAEQNRRGDFGQMSKRTIDKIDRGLNQGREAALLNKSSLSADLQKFARDNGYKDVVNWNEQEIGGR
jgi:hypothetical protein